MEEYSLIKYKSDGIEKVTHLIALTNIFLRVNENINLIIEKTSNSPYINFNASTGIFKIEGKSVNEEADIFYRPILNWVNEFNNSFNDNINFRIQLDYVNADSATIILSMLNHIIGLANNLGIKCHIDWYYKKDDEFILELGENYKKYLKVPFEIIEQKM